MYINARQEIDKDVKEKYQNCEWGAVSLFEFLEEEQDSTIELDLRNQPQSGWKLKHLSRNKVCFSHM